MAAKISYLHNALGQRVFKSEPQVDHVAPSASAWGQPFIDWLLGNFGWLFAQAQYDATLGQSYVYDDAQLASTPLLLGEYGNGGSLATGRREYIWLPTEDGQAIPVGLFRGVNLNAIHTDHLGTPRRITNWSNSVDWQWPYSAFGENLPNGILAPTTDATLAYTTDTATNTHLEARPSPISFNLRFAGQYFDQESNLSYNYFRSYQPAQGRYTQSDPIGLGGGLNRFGYVEGNPLSFTDPMGLAGIDVPIPTPIRIPAPNLIPLIPLIPLIIPGDTPKDQCKCQPALPANIRAVLSTSPMLTLQPTVSARHTQSLVTAIMAGGTLPPIQVDGNVIVDGNHRYVAGLLCNQPAATQPWTAPLTKPRIPVSQLQIVP